RRAGGARRVGAGHLQRADVGGPHAVRLRRQRLSTWVIVVAAGRGERFGGAKQYEQLGDRRVLDWSLQAARAVADGIVLVVPAEDVARAEEGTDAVVAGGATRSASVRAGLARVAKDAEVIVVHDAARPLAPASLFESVV